jgi:hypothetical protein
MQIRPCQSISTMTLTSDQKVAGSSPARCTTGFVGVLRQYRRPVPRGRTARRSVPTSEVLGIHPGVLPQTQPHPGTSEVGRFLRKRHSAEHDREAAFSMAGTLDGQAIFMASTTGTDRSEIGPYLGYLLAAIGNAFRLQPPMVHPL